MFCYITYIFTCFGIVNHRTTGNFNNLIRSVFTETTVLTARLPMTSHCMTIISQVKQCPVIPVTTQDNMASSSAISSIRSTVRSIFFSPHVRRASSAFTRAAVYLYVINKIRFSHNQLFFRCNHVPICPLAINSAWSISAHIFYNYNVSTALQISSKIPSMVPRPLICWYLPSPL